MIFAKNLRTTKIQFDKFFSPADIFGDFATMKASVFS